ncbi:MAG: DUF2169 domain-containing protein [Polyangiaceae bacterium]|nr:DUF2169 domain-containing protein [Polyangiaceae bacterium]
MTSRRVIVAQPSSLVREGNGLLQVGVLRWEVPPRRAIVETESGRQEVIYGTVPMMTVIVKVALSYAHCLSESDEMTLSTEPEGLCLDVPIEVEAALENEIAYPSDFVPLKRFADVLLTGHAYSTHPKTQFSAGFSFGQVQRGWMVTSAVPATRAPLVQNHIAPDPDGTAVPPPGPTPTRLLLEEYPMGFDFAEFNTGPDGQRVDEIALGTQLTLKNLSARAPELTVRVPNITPALWVDTSEERNVPLEVTCDTLWVDTDRELVVLVYRGLLRIPSLDFDGVSKITLALGKNGNEPTLEEVERELAKGAFESAVELSDFDEETQIAPLEMSLFEQMKLLETNMPPTLSLAAYAQITAELAEGKASRKEVLLPHGYSEITFLVEEKAWLSQIADAAMKGNTDLAAQYGELFVAAQDSLAAPNEGQETLEAYVTLKVDVEDAIDPAKVLSDNKMTLAAWMRMDRRWTSRAMKDIALSEQIDRACAAYRARREEG